MDGGQSLRSKEGGHRKDKYSVRGMKVGERDAGIGQKEEEEEEEEEECLHPLSTWTFSLPLSFCPPHIPPITGRPQLSVVQE